MSFYEGVGGLNPKFLIKTQKLQSSMIFSRLLYGILVMSVIFKGEVEYDTN